MDVSKLMVIWPNNVDSTRTIKKGRRIPKASGCELKSEWYGRRGRGRGLRRVGGGVGRGGRYSSVVAVPSEPIFVEERDLASPSPSPSPLSFDDVAGWRTHMIARSFAHVSFFFSGRGRGAGGGERWCQSLLGSIK